MLAPWKKNYEPRQHIKKQRHHFAHKSLSSENYGFPSSQVQMWELDHKEGWEPKNWCFQTMVLEKTLECLLDWKEIKTVNPKGNQPWIYFERTDAETEAPMLWPPRVKNWLTGKDSRYHRNTKNPKKILWTIWQPIRSEWVSKNIYPVKTESIKKIFWTDKSLKVK